MHGVLVASRYGRAYMEAPLRRLAEPAMKNERSLARSLAATKTLHSVFTPIRDTLARGGPIGGPEDRSTPRREWGGGRWGERDGGE